jgi:hypothetical protein
MSSVTVAVSSASLLVQHHAMHSTGSHLHSDMVSNHREYCNNNQTHSFAPGSQLSIASAPTVVSDYCNSNSPLQPVSQNEQNRRRQTCSMVQLPDSKRMKLAKRSNAASSKSNRYQRRSSKRKRNVISNAKGAAAFPSRRNHGRGLGLISDIPADIVSKRLQSFGAPSYISDEQLAQLQRKHPRLDCSPSPPPVLHTVATHGGATAAAAAIPRRFHIVSHNPGMHQVRVGGTAAATVAVTADVLDMKLQGVKPHRMLSRASSWDEQLLMRVVRFAQDVSIIPEVQVTTNAAAAAAADTLPDSVGSKPKSKGGRGVVSFVASQQSSFNESVSNISHQSYLLQCRAGLSGLALHIDSNFTYTDVRGRPGRKKSQTPWMLPRRAHLASLMRVFRIPSSFDLGKSVSPSPSPSP